MMNNIEIERIILEKGTYILKKTREQEASLLNKNWWYGKILSWTMKSNSFKTKMFHFIDVLPSLKTPKQIVSHLNEYFAGEELGLLSSGFGSLAPSLMANMIKKQVNQVAKIFITGATIDQAIKVIPKLRSKNQCFSFDILGEATLSEQEALSYQSLYLELMDALIKERENWEPKKAMDEDKWEKIPSVNISIKISSLYHHIREEAWEFSKQEIKKKLQPIFKKAVENFIFINLDMEHYNYKNLFFEIFEELLMEDEFKNYPHFGIVLQSYLKDSLTDAKSLIQFAKKRKCPFSVRLVKGAYWDSEVLMAKQKNWPIPVYTVKEHTDANFEKVMELLFENSHVLKLAVGSHNIRSIAKALALHKLHPKANLEFQTLYGMGESVSQVLTEEGYTVRLYSTIGELIPGMSYLVRRLLENTSNQSFIRSALSTSPSKQDLLSAPQAAKNNTTTKHSLKNNASIKNESEDSSKASTKFKNHPILDFSLAENRIKFQKSLDDWKGKFPLPVHIILNGDQVHSSQIENRENPSDTKQIISKVHFADKTQAEKAIQITDEFFETWKNTPTQKRIKSLRKLASLMKQKEFELASLQVFEVGKTWVESHGDVCEAIDFCEFYANNFEQLSLPKKTCEISGEESLISYEPIGVAAAIAPWNFPLAILTGMVVAPLVCGNTVIIKPAEQSSLIAYQLAKLLLESGFPKQSFAFLPGEGEVVGDYLVKHPQVSIVSFTGSFEVGSQIIKHSSGVSKNQKHFKKVIAEMGGKNSIIIDLSADLDEAIFGILGSAFGFQGQKCSACSRVIILEEVYDKFIERFLPAAKSLIMDKTENPRTFLGPVVDKDSYHKIQTLIQNQNPTNLIYQGQKLEGGWFIPPTIFLESDSNSTLMQDEFFAPVLTIFKVKDLDEALKQANNIRYGLTSGLYSRRPSSIEKFKNQIEAGNAYINRNCTGALVERHPFGGYKMSGLGSKTGQPDYIKQFLHTKITTENTMRRGFAPEIFLEDFVEK